jgi:hypothetical protein
MVISTQVRDRAHVSPGLRFSTEPRMSKSGNTPDIHRSLTVAAPTCNGAATVRERWISVRSWSHDE